MASDITTALQSVPAPPVKTRTITMSSLYVEMEDTYQLNPEATMYKGVAYELRQQRAAAQRHLAQQVNRGKSTDPILRDAGIAISAGTDDEVGVIAKDLVRVNTKIKALTA